MQYTKPLSSYDDLVKPDFVLYCYELVSKWIESCKHNGQMGAANNLVNLFRSKYPEEHSKGQELYRTYWQLKRQLNQF